MTYFTSHRRRYTGGRLNSRTRRGRRGESRDGQDRTHQNDSLRSTRFARLFSLDSLRSNTAVRQTSNDRLPLKVNSNHPETSATSISNDSQQFIFRPNKNWSANIFETNLTSWAFHSSESLRKPLGTLRNHPETFRIVLKYSETSRNVR